MLDPVRNPALIRLKKLGAHDWVLFQEVSSPLGAGRPPIEEHLLLLSDQDVASILADHAEIAIPPVPEAPVVAVHADPSGF